MRVEISSALVARIVAEAGASADEICGLLMGEPVPNRHAGLVPASTVDRMQPTIGSDQRWMPEHVRHDGGEGLKIDTILPCRNVATYPSRHFEIDPVALIAAHRAARAGGPAIVGHYHSHPSGNPIPSATDAAAACTDGAIWLIVSAGDVRAWRAVRDGAVHGRFDPVALMVARQTRVGHETRLV